MPRPTPAPAEPKLPTPPAEPMGPAAAPAETKRVSPKASVVRPKLSSNPLALRATPSDPPKIVGPIRALDTVMQDPATLQRWNTRHYRFFTEVPRKMSKEGVIYIESKRKLVGTIALETELQADRIALRDAWWELNGEHTPLDVEIRYAPDNLLSPQRIIVDPQHKPTAAELRRGNYDLKVNGYRITGDWPVGTVSKPALLRLVGMLPREPGAAFSFPYFTEVPNLEIVKNEDPIVCVGPEMVQLQYKTVPCTKFQWQDVAMWVRNSDGILAKLERPGYVMLELSELPGCEVVPRPLPRVRPGTPIDPGSPEPPKETVQPPKEATPGVPMRPIVPPPAEDPFKS